MGTAIQVVIDCADPAKLAGFWAGALHYELQAPPPGYDSWPAWLAAHDVPEDAWNAASAVVDPAGSGPRVFFQRVPEPKTVKNRVHLDLSVSGGPSAPPAERRERVDTEVGRLRGIGATVLGSVEERGEYHVGMADPEGNEFDVQ